MNGYIKLFRKIQQWKWYKNVKTFKAFVHCLIEANYIDKKYEDQIIPRGSFLTGRKKFSDESGLTEQETRSAWTNLKSTNEITTASTNKGTLITVVNYDEYQPLVEILTNSSTNDFANEQPTNNQRITTTNNIKNINNNSVCNIECHLGANFKMESCYYCMKKNKCSVPTSSNFILKHGCTFEEWISKKEELYKQWAEERIKNNKPVNPEIFEYEWFREVEGEKCDK